MKVDLPDSMVLCIAGCANADGPGIEVMVQMEWWTAAPKEVRKTMFMAILAARRKSARRSSAKSRPMEWEG